MAKTGLFGFGYINEGIFYGKLSDHLGRDVTVQDKQLIHNHVQQALDAGCIEYYTCDKQGAVTIAKTAPQQEREILAKAVSIGIQDRQNQEILAYVCQQPRRKWSTVYVGARGAVYGILSAYHIGYLNFKNFKEADDFIQSIHEILLPGEQWGFAKGEDNPALLRRTTRYQILESYLRHTFSKLMLEYNRPTSDNYAKIVFSQDKKYCYFNTGLLTKYAQDLYLTGEVHAMKDDGIFTCNNPRFVDSKIELVKTYGFAQRDIDPGPPGASFYRSVSDIVYDPSISIDFTESKLEHIIDDGIRRNRFPRKYTVAQNGKTIPPWSLAQMLNNSIKIACMMAQRNYKYVIPQYRPAGVEYINGKKVQYDGQIQFLMPIYLSADYFSPPDFALVLSRRDGFYVPETILLLPWAYNNARILCKPDNSWLTPSAIDPDDLLLEEYDLDDDDDDEQEHLMHTPVMVPQEIPVAQKPKKVEAPVPEAPKAVVKPIPDAPAVKPVAKEKVEAVKPPEKKQPAKAQPKRVKSETAAPVGNSLPEDAQGKGDASPSKPRAAQERVDKPIAIKVDANGDNSLNRLPIADKKAEKPEKAAKTATVAADDSNIGQVVTMNFTGTTAAKALKGESTEKLQGTISAKRLGGHKALEFHGLTAKVKILSRNSCGDSYQCEMAEDTGAVLARKTQDEQPEKTLKAEKPEKAEKAQKVEKSVAKAQPRPTKVPAAAKAEQPAKSGWAWANPANFFTQRTTVVDSFRDLAIGQRYNAIVHDQMPYGYFVDIGYAEGNVLLHKSQIAEGALLTEGDVIIVWVHVLDAQKKKVQVTMNRPD